MDISRLTEDQKEYAYKVGQAAVKQGLNPDFVLPMVYQESGFNPKAISPSGAIGLMQLMPATAKSLGVDPEDIDQNIKGGLMYIKQLMQNPKIGSDPYKILAGYHSGEGEASKFLETGNINDLGPKAKQHLWDVSQRYGKELPTATYAQPEDQTETDAESPEKKEIDFNLQKLPTTKETGKEEEGPAVPAYVGAIVGGVGGGAAGTTGAITKAKYDAGKEAYDILKSKISPGGAPLTLAESSLIPSEAQHTRAIEGTKKDTGITGRASQTTYNLRTQQIAEEAAEKKRVMEQLRRANILSKTAPNIPGIVASTPAGIIAPTEAVQGLEAAAAQPAGAVASKSSPLWSYARRLLGLPVKGALYGAGIGFGAVDAYNRARAGENQEAMIGGAGTAAGLASTFVPALTTAGALPAASVAAPLYLAASDRLRRLQKHPEEYQLYEEDVDPLGFRIR